MIIKFCLVLLMLLLLDKQRPKIKYLFNLIKQLKNYVILHVFVLLINKVYHHLNKMYASSNFIFEIIVEEYGPHTVSIAGISK